MPRLSPSRLRSSAWYPKQGQQGQLDSQSEIRSQDRNWAAKSQLLHLWRDSPSSAQGGEDQGVILREELAGVLISSAR